MQESSRNSGKQLESEQLPVGVCCLGDCRHPLCPGRNSPAAPTEQGTLPHLWHCCFFHMCSQCDLQCEGRKVLKSQWKTATKFHWTGNDYI